MNETAIPWTGRTWNPASGCVEISPGCKFCYAKTLAERYLGTSAFPNGFDLTIRPHKLREPHALKEPSLIFVNSMSDLFWEAIPDSYRDQVLDVIEATPRHQYQVLTKRPENMLRYSRRRRLPSNFWAGTSIESCLYAARADILRQVQAEVRFISAEPLLSPLVPALKLDGLHWVITGGESGLHLKDAALRGRRGLAELVDGRWVPRADRAHWITDLRDACVAAGVKFFHKQWGGLRPTSAGRLVDGRTWDELPREREVARAA